MPTYDLVMQSDNRHYTSRLLATAHILNLHHERLHALTFKSPLGPVEHN